jgi:hypothetical protein
MQGGGMNDSESWAQASPLLAADGKAMLLALEARLPARERAARLNAMSAAGAFIDRCEIAGGIRAQVSRSFLVSGDRANRRVDIEVHSGVAFVSPSSATVP